MYPFYLVHTITIYPNSYIIIKARDAGDEWRMNVFRKQPWNQRWNFGFELWNLCVDCTLMSPFLAAVLLCWECWAVQYNFNCQFLTPSKWSLGFTKGFMDSSAFHQFQLVTALSNISHNLGPFHLRQTFVCILKRCSVIYFPNFMISYCGTWLKCEGSGGFFFPIHSMLKLLTPKTTTASMRETTVLLLP